MSNNSDNHDGMCGGDAADDDDDDDHDHDHDHDKGQSKANIND